jgi:hypothetical protein
LNPNIVDMTHILLPNCEQSLCDQVDSYRSEPNPKLRFYFRTIENQRIFACFQYNLSLATNTTESNFTESIELCGWILQIGNVFYFGKSSLTLEQSFKKIYEFIPQAIAANYISNPSIC